MIPSQTTTLYDTDDSTVPIQSLTITQFCLRAFFVIAINIAKIQSFRGAVRLDLVSHAFLVHPYVGFSILIRKIKKIYACGFWKKIIVCSESLT